MNGREVHKETINEAAVCKEIDAINRCGYSTYEASPQLGMHWP